MDLQQLITDLSKPQAYPNLVDEIEVRQTHISVVFLAGGFVYKLKKPVNFGFLDFSTLEKRKHYCEEEVRLNRRLARDVYEGVVPVTQQDDRLEWGGAGDVVEWGVKMRRLPDAARLGDRLQRGEIRTEDLIELGRVLADFHHRAVDASQAEQYGSFATVTGNARENFSQSARQIGSTISSAVFSKLQQLTERELAARQALIATRAAAGRTKETHGDLHLKHVYFFPEAHGAARWVIIDCIEFSERFRFADPIADVAFLLMDLRFHGHAEAARVLAEAYQQASGDVEGMALLPFYTAYRASVRGKVEGMELLEEEIPQEEKDAARNRSRAHWLLAYRILLPAQERPRLLGIGGLPGTGKTTLAQKLAETERFTLIRSDMVRKELAGLPATATGAAGFGEGLYSPALTERTYAECLRRAEERLFQGESVIVDANFRAPAQRQQFYETARRWALPPLLLWCQTDPSLVKERLERRRADASDADWAIYQQAAAQMEPFSSREATWIEPVATDADFSHVLDTARRAIRQLEQL
jgi:aminoglycoside phosphotransferase family enzyme/predicted kinase